MKNSTNALSVFLVDDDALFLTALRFKLTEKFKSSIRINTFADGEECLRHMDAKPDIVVLDYYLDHSARRTLNGIEVLKEIKKVSEDTEVVMLSAEEKQEVKEKSLNLGAYKFLNKKEVSGHTLQNTIKDLIHEIILARNARANTQVNYIMGGIVGLVAGIIAAIYLRFF